MGRQIGEALKIASSNPSLLMNSKAEFGMNRFQKVALKDTTQEEEASPAASTATVSKNTSETFGSGRPHQDGNVCSTTEQNSRPENSVTSPEIIEIIAAEQPQEETRAITSAQD